MVVLFLRQLANRKVRVNLDCCPEVSPNTCTHTTMKPTPEGVSIHIELSMSALKFWRFSGAHQVKANTSFMSMPLLYVNYLIHC